MKKIILIVLLISSPIIYSKDIYPVEKSFSVEPSISSGLLIPIKAKESGGEITAKINFVNIAENINFTLAGGYNYLNNNEVIPGVKIGFTSGYNFHTNYININPVLGFSIYSGLYDNYVELVNGINFEMHIFNRNILILNTSLNSAYNNGIETTLGISMGMKSSKTIFIPVKRVKLDIKLSPKRFSPDNDGVNDLLNIDIDVKRMSSVKNWRLVIFDSKGYQIQKWRGARDIPSKIVWNGLGYNSEIIHSASDYSVKLFATDYLGNIAVDNSTFTSDILVIKDKERFIINVPSIIFPPNSADFSLLDSEIQDDNKSIIENIGEKLLKFPNYKVRIEGHGNILNYSNEEWLNKENNEILIPLTLKRAASVMELLIEFGISRDRLVAVGQGGSYPRVPFNDYNNKWKNRRVEFILLK